MGIHWGRLFLVLGIVGVLAGAGGGVYWFLHRGQDEASVATAAAEKAIEAKDFASAKVETEKLLKLKPQAGYPHYLHALALLEGKTPSDFSPTDTTGVAAVRALLQVTVKDPTFLPARRMLVAHFVNIGEIGPAADQARQVIEKDPSDLVSVYAVAASMVPAKSQEAAKLIERLLAEEQPPRPRTIWLAAQVGETLRDRADWVKVADDWIAANQKSSQSDISDRLSLIELRLWQANRSNDPALAEQQVRASMADLRVLSQNLATSHLSPRLVLRTAGRLLPGPARRRPELAATYQTLEPEVDKLIDDVFQAASDAKVLDPALYIGQARRLRSMGKVDEAVELLKEAIKSAEADGEQTRQLFVDCDLWLAEYFLDEGQGDQAEPYIATLLAHPVLQPAGQVLAGYRMIQQGKFNEAAASLSAALPKLPEHGAAHALYGLCQLRRGMISDGRQYLEKGVSLGAKSARYKAWLALALAEGGYHDQAMTVARDLLESGEYTAIGRTLVGQLRLQAGDFEQAASDLDAAFQGADQQFRPSIRLAQAELALARGDETSALAALDELEQSSLADQAQAMRIRHEKRQGRTEQANALLKKARAEHPDSMLLLALDVQRLLDAHSFAEAESLLGAVREKDPKSVAAIMLLVQVYDQADQPERGIELLEKSAAEMPGEASLKIRLIEKLLGMRRFAEAAKKMELLGNDPTINPTTVDYLQARSAALQGDMTAAQQFIERAAAKDPDNPTLKFLMGQLAAQKGDFSTATEMFEQSLAGGNHRQQTVQALFESLLRVGDTDRAVEILGQAEKRGQSVRTLRVQLLRLLARQEDWEALDREVSTILSQSPTEDDFLLVISAFRYVRQPAKAADYLAKALAAFPQSFALREQQASLLVETGDLAGAESKIGALISEQPENAMLHVLRIYLLQRLGKKDAADAAIEDAWTRAPGHPAIAALRVQSLLRDGQTEQAVRFAEKAKKEYPTLPDPRYLVARMHESLGNLDKSMSLLNVLVAEDPKNPRVAENYFRLLIQTGLPRDVPTSVEKLISSQPDNTTLIGALAEYRALQGDLAGAERTIAQLEKIKTAGSMVPYTKGVLAFARRDFKEAERLALVVTADSKGHMPATFLLARVHAAQGDYATAIDLAGRVCRQQPRNPTAHLFLARLLGETGDWPKAEGLARGFLKDNGSDRSMKLLLARALLSRGGEVRGKEAADIAWSVFESGIRGGEELEAVMNVLFAAGQSERCRQIITEFESRSASPENLLAAGRASFIAGDFATAARLADQVLVARKDDLDALMLAADTETRVGAASEDETHYEKAIEFYRRILAKDPTSAPAANNLAWTLGVSLGKETQALEEILRYVPAAAERSPMVSIDVLDTIGTLYLRMSKYEQARIYFEEVTRREPDNAMARFRLGQIFDRLGRTDRAEQEYAEAKRLSPTENWEARKHEAGLGN